jgi:N-acetylglucosamine-6-phosphate deacetylase
VDTVAKGIVAHGVTAFCPTLITQSRESYHKVLSRLEKRVGGPEKGAAVLGLHLEGPFISHEKRGAHPPQFVKSDVLGSPQEVIDYYRDMENVAIVTMAPELDPTGKVTHGLVKKGVVVSVGHSSGSLTDGERVVNSGAGFMTHLFNAMLPFHHRDPGLVGLLTSTSVNRPVFYGIIADGIHTHYAALKIAHKANPHGLVLVTDAISPMGLPSGRHKIGAQDVEIKNDMAFVAGTDILCGSIATMDACVRNFKEVTGCTDVEAIECATLHPAQVLGISHKKGTLEFGADADFLILDHSFHVLKTYIAGDCVWEQ